MADNFDMKKFLVENKLGAYSKLKETTESGLTPLQQYIYDYEVEISGEDFANEELEDIKKLNTLNDVEKYYGAYRGWDTDKDFKYDLIRLLKTLKAKKLAEGEAAYEYEKGKAAGEKEEKEKLTKEGGDEDKLPLTPKMKKFIDKVISDAKKDGEFEELVQVDYFENDLIDFILEKFDEEGNYDNVSQEVKDYINKSVKDYYRNPDGTPFFSEDLGQDRTDAEAEKMMDFLAEKDKTEEALGGKNPEGDKLVLRFLQGVAKKFDYPVAKAAIFVKDTIKSLGY